MNIEEVRKAARWANDELARRDAEAAERELPITEEWLESIGFCFDATNREWFNEIDCVSVLVKSIRDKTTKKHAWSCCVGKGGEESRLDWTMSIRAQLLDLLTALKGGA